MVKVSGLRSLPKRSIDLLHDVVEGNVERSENSSKVE